MPRRREVAKRVIIPDPKYNDRTVAKLVNVIMIGGKKSTAERALYGALDLVVVSDFAGADETTRSLVTRVAAHNDVLALFTNHPKLGDIPRSQTQPR